MAKTPRSKKSKTKVSKSDTKPSKIKVIEAHLEDKADEEYYNYGLHVIEDRAIFGNIDGLKPVTRRALWAAHTLRLHHTANYEKSAMVVGETMGKYHPHGDSSIYGAMVTAAKAPLNMIDGDGNWGTMTDDPAAMRYTNCRLSKYSDKVFFDKFYLAVRDDVANYDGSRKEPLILPSLLPNALLNGNFGIAPGVRTQTPTITLKSLIPAIVATLKEGKCTPEICKNIVLTTELGAILRRTSDTKKELKEFLKTGKGRFTFDSAYTEKGNELRFDAFAPFSNVESVLSKIEGINGVSFTRDDSDKTDKYEKAYVVGLTKTLKGAARDTVVKKVVDAFSANVSYNIQATHRFLDEKRPDGGKKLHPATIPLLIDQWITYRIDLEKRACLYWTNERQVEIDYLKLMLLAVKNRKFIIQALDKKFTDDELAAYIAKHLKITVPQANQILDLKIRQLKSLEEKKLLDKIKVLKEEIAGYADRIKRPKTYITKQVTEFAKEFTR